MLNNIVDYHVHTSRCGHATGRMAEYVEAAMAAGLAELGFSDHIPMYWLPGDQPDPTSAMAMSELESYVADVQRLQAQYKGFPIRLGLEADYIPGGEGELARILALYPWDYVIGSVHFMDDWNFDHPAYVARYAEWDIDLLYRRFFDLELAAIRSGFFDIMGHLDLIKKFGHRPTGDLREIYAAVADAAAAAGVAVELSTAGLRKPVHEYYPHQQLLAECARRGVPLVLSSDAHAPGEVAWGFPEARAHALATGFTTVAKFAGRRRTLLPRAYVRGRPRWEAPGSFVFTVPLPSSRPDMRRCRGCRPWLGRQTARSQPS
ncbi:MAG: histidinol-phosphatase HisJ family protein [Mycobacterium leprae]